MSTVYLAAVGNVQDLPDWLTQKYLDKCVSDKELQKNWDPKVGDRYYCVDLYKVMQITSLDGYYSEGEIPPLKSDHGKDSRGRWQCDFYIPEPRA